MFRRKPAKMTMRISVNTTDPAVYPVTSNVSIPTPIPSSLPKSRRFTMFLNLKNTAQCGSCGK